MHDSDMHTNGPLSESEAPRKKGCSSPSSRMKQGMVTECRVWVYSSCQIIGEFGR